MFRSLRRPQIAHAVVAFLALFAIALIGGCATSLGTGGTLSNDVSRTESANQQSGSDITVAQGQQPGIGGTGAPGTKAPGIGGTGNVAGTPGIGGTGIIGTVTGFGSILVNGFKVDYAPDMPIGFKDATVRPDALRIGQVVEIEASGSGNRLQARRISIRHEVAGPIERIDHARRVAVVFGQRIQIPSGIVFTAAGSRRLTIDDLRVGDHIDVSGLRQANGVIAASHVDKTGPGAAAVIRGRVTSSDPSGFSVNGMRVEAPRSAIRRALVSGQDVLIVGTAVGGKLRARRVNPAPTRPFEGRVAQLSIEGYVTRAISGGVAIGVVPITRLPASARLRAGDRIILDGPVDGRGRFAPSRVRQPRATNIRGDAPRSGNRLEPAPRTQVLPPAPRPPYPRPAYPRPAPRPPVYRSPSRTPRR